MGTSVKEARRGGSVTPKVKPKRMINQRGRIIGSGTKHFRISLRRKE